jgi:CubicO group peptidase (beta-lactamase class C family)
MKLAAFVLLLLSGCASAAGPRDAQTLAAFIDPLIESKMRAQQIPGAAFVYVKNGRVLYAKGYGLADVERKVPVSPETTIWRIGSISKVFTATALMQLADRGAIDIDRPVNAALRSLQTDPRVTARQLLDHTAGFDEIRPGTQAATAPEVLPLAEFLRTRLVVVRTPGEVTSYSTYGITLAGLLVEELSGMRYEDYERERIWRLLGMTRTNITVPPELKPDLAIGYELIKGKLEPQAWEWYHTTPASSINSTALDMARFAIAHLDEDVRLLSRRSMREMHRTQVTMHPRLPGWALGFIEDRIGNQRVIEHGGSVAGFSSQLVLIPESREGFYLVSQFEQGHFRDEVKEELLKHFFPRANERQTVPAPRPSERVKTLAGRYVWTTSCHTCTPRSAPFILQLKVSGDGTIEFAGNRWIEVEPFLFVQKDGTGYIFARPPYVFAGGFWSFEKVGD